VQAGGGSSAGGSSSAGVVVPISTDPPTTAPKPRSSGTPITGWERIGDSEWPARGDSVIAVALGRTLDVLRTPGDRTGAIKLEQGRSMFGPVRLLALGEKNGWIKVAVPIRPNGTVGYVSRSDVRIQRNFVHVQIELSTNTLRVYDGDQLSIETKVAAGTGGTPTPTGLFFVKELVPQTNPAGALGPFAFGLSGFSTVLNTFGNGEGTIGIHGTNAPNKLGGDVSHGCVRVINATILSMTKIIPLGAPVEIIPSWADLPTARRGSDWVDRLANPSPTAASPVPGDATTTSTEPPSTEPPSTAPSSTAPSTTAP
jgi:L,D-transpeptidase catalytic domain